MKLIEYLKKEGISQGDFAKQIDRSVATVSRICRGLNPPDWQTMIAIERETEGKVTPNDFLPEPEQAPAEPTESERIAS